MTYAGEVAGLLDAYEGDPEHSHAEEDRLLERFVRLRAKQGDVVAKALVRLLDEDRTRWYA